MDANLKQDVQNQQNVLLLFASSECLHRFIVQIDTHSLCKIDEVIIPLESADVYVEQLLVRSR